MSLRASICMRSCKSVLDTTANKDRHVHVAPMYGY